MNEDKASQDSGENGEGDRREHYDERVERKYLPCRVRPVWGVAVGALALAAGFALQAARRDAELDLSAPPKLPRKVRPTPTPIPPPPVLPRPSAEQAAALRTAFASTDAWADKYFPPRPQPSIVVCEPVASEGAQALGDGCARWLHLSLVGSPGVGGSPMWQRVEYARLSVASEKAGSGQSIARRMAFRVGSADVAALSQATGASIIAVGKLGASTSSDPNDPRAPITLSYEVWDARDRKKLGVASASGARGQASALLPNLARRIGDLASLPSDIPARCELSTREMEAVGAAPWCVGGVAWRVPLASRAQVKVLESLAPRSAVAALLCLFNWTDTRGDARYAKVQKHLLRLAPRNALAWSGAAWLDAGSLPQKDLVALSRRYPNNALLCAARGLRAIADGDEAAVARWHGRAAQLSPRDPLWWRWVGQSYSDQAGALRGARAAAKISRAEWDKLHLWYGLWLAACGRASRLDGRDADTWKEVCTAATFNGRDDLSEPALWAGLGLEPEHENLHFWGLQMFQPKWTRGRMESVKMLVQRVESIPPLFNGLHTRAIGALNEGGQNAQATQMLTRVLNRFNDYAREHPNDPMTHLYLARLAQIYGFKDTQLETMLNEYRAYLKLAPWDADVHFTLGEALLKRKNDVAGARAEFLATLKIKPAHQEARQALADLPQASGA